MTESETRCMNRICFVYRSVPNPVEDTFKVLLQSETYANRLHIVSALLYRQPAGSVTGSCTSYISL